MTSPPDKTAPRQNGRFVKGVSGNPRGCPRGSRHRATLAAEALLEGEAEKLTRKAVEKALEGDSAALRLCLERILPARKDRSVMVDLPPIETAKDLVAAASALAQAATIGAITPSEAADLSRLVANTAQAIEVAELEERIRKIEEAQAANGGA
jgi:hypothetical protein